MAVSIRLRREGALNRPYYKVVVADSRSPREGKFIEIIGTYDPKKPGHNSTLKLDRAEYWIARGAQPSDTVRNLIKKNKNPGAAAEKAAAAAAKKAAAAPKAAPAPVAVEPAVASAPAAPDITQAPAPAVEAPAAPEPESTSSPESP
jgi:small subunit ribosomal protein S16